MAEQIIHNKNGGENSSVFTVQPETESVNIHNGGVTYVLPNYDYESLKKDSNNWKDEKDLIWKNVSDLNKRKFWLTFLSEGSYFEDDKFDFLDLINPHEEQSILRPSNLFLFGNYYLYSKEVISAELVNRFEIPNKEEVFNFLINNRDHFLKVLEFYALIFDYVEDSRLLLEYLKDPEEDCETLNIIVQTDLSPQDALEIEDKIFYDYFEDIFMNEALKLNFRIVSNGL